MRFLEELVLSFRPYLTSEEAIIAKPKILLHLSATLLGAVLVLALWQFPMFGLQGFLVDFLFRAQTWTSPHPAVALIAYDDESSIRYSGSAKIPAKEISWLVEKLQKSQPMAIALLAPVNDKIYNEAELQTLAAGFSKLSNVYIGYTDDESLGKNAPPALRHSARYLPGFISRDTFSYGADSVTRRVMVSIEGIPTVFIKLAQLYNDAHPKSNPSKEPAVYERFNNAVQTYIRWQGPQGTYPIHSTAQVIESDNLAETFKDKIVLISSSLASKKGADHIFTPYSRNHFDTTALEGAAHSLVTLIRQDGIRRSSPTASIFLTLFIAILTVNLVLALSPAKGIGLVAAVMLTLIASSALLLFREGIWTDLAHPLLAAFLAYYLVIPYRLFNEYRKRWHYQEKSELMAQLERLKSNFLSLVSHDLKTPIARIQGNAELALNDGSFPITPTQKQSLDAILHTTEDLSRYVESVLDLTRIENAKVPLQKVSKDINAIILDVVEQHRYLADDKKISIVTKAEPLFSIKFDPKLIRQVITNLLLNAIKYSPEGTTVTVRSFEDGPWVKVSIQDEGYGIAKEDQEKVFQKFYRVQDESVSKIKGTGLGLYLVKYFVELHGGKVVLESDLGKGSTFTIELPA